MRYLLALTTISAMIGCGGQETSKNSGSSTNDSEARAALEQKLMAWQGRSTGPDLGLALPGHALSKLMEYKIVSVQRKSDSASTATVNVKLKTYEGRTEETQWHYTISKIKTEWNIMVEQ